MAGADDMAIIAAIGAGAYFAGRSGGGGGLDPDDVMKLVSDLPGKTQQASASAQDMAALATAISSASQTAPQIIRVGSEGANQTSDTIRTIREIVEDRTQNPPEGEDGSGNSGSADGNGEVDSGSTSTGTSGVDTSQSEDYDLQDEPGTGAVSTAARTTGEAGASAGEAVDATVDTLARAGNTLSQATRAVTGKEYDTTGTFEESISGSGEKRRIYEGSVVGGAGDAIAGVADDLAGSTDEWVGRTTKGWF